MISYSKCIWLASFNKLMKWSVYNQSLVRRGKLLLGFDILTTDEQELKDMNKDLPGESFHYPITFLLFLLGYS